MCLVRPAWSTSLPVCCCGRDLWRCWVEHWSLLGGAGELGWHRQRAGWQAPAGRREPQSRPKRGGRTHSAPPLAFGLGSLAHPVFGSSEEGPKETKAEYGLDHIPINSNTPVTPVDSDRSGAGSQRHNWPILAAPASGAADQHRTTPANMPSAAGSLCALALAAVLLVAAGVVICCANTLSSPSLSWLHPFTLYAEHLKHCNLHEPCVQLLLARQPHSLGCRCVCCCGARAAEAAATQGSPAAASQQQQHQHHQHNKVPCSHMQAAAAARSPVMR